MNRINLEALAVADGVVLSVHSEPGDLIVAFKDWQEKNWVITFKGVSAYENFGIEGVDLSHVETCAGDDFRTRAAALLKEPLADAKCYAFLCASTDQALLRILAEACEVSEAES